MRKVIFILTILAFHLNLYSQKEIVGKVEYYMSFSYGTPNLDSATDKTLEYLNSKKQSVEIRQGTSIREFETDSSGVFKCAVNPNEKLFISINKKSKTANADFSFEPTQLNDTLKLKISDLRTATYRDSISSPEFYNQYSINQAYSDFENGNLRVLAGGGFLSKKTIKRREKITKEYGIKYEYIYGCIVSATEMRIVHRYNETMKQLVGIKNVW